MVKVDLNHLVTEIKQTTTVKETDGARKAPHIADASLRRRQPGLSEKDD